MYLEKDAFRVEYEPMKVSLDQIFERIRDLGYDPSQMELPKARERTAAGSMPTKGEHSDLPEPIAAKARAGDDDQLIFVDFHAEWCAPCRALERTVLSKRRVREALEAFRFVRVDTDTFPDAARHFGVVGLPTLIVVDRKGNERFRHVGPITVDRLVRTLDELRGAKPKSED